MVIEWESIGQLSNFKKVNGNGVYLFVFDNCKIIYIGTSFRKTNKGLRARLNENVRLFRCGGRTMRIPEPGQDIYEIFKLENIQGKELHDCYKYWIPSYDIINACFISEFKNVFDNDWKDIAENYLSRITVYIAKMVDKGLGRNIESRLQYELSQYFNIADYITTKGTKSGKFWKQEIKSYLLEELEMRFNGDLLVDCQTEEMLKEKFNWQKVI